MNHVMIDIETMGASVNSALVSVAAVFFDPDTGNLGQEFYQPIKLASSQYYGFEVEASTVEWWLQQSEEAVAVLKDENRIGLKPALEALSQFIMLHRDDENVHVWGNGPAFDNAILSNAFSKLYVKKPWKYSKDRCVRTFSDIAVVHGGKSLKDTPFEGTAHNALDDAKHQARFIAGVYVRMGMTGYVNDAPLRPAEVRRDEDGYWSHPEFPEWGEGTLQQEITEWTNQRHVTISSLLLEFDESPEACEAQEKYFKEGEPDCSLWNPQPKSPDGFLISIHDTEDGPCALFAYPIEPEANQTESQAA